MLPLTIGELSKQDDTWESTDTKDSLKLRLPEPLQMFDVPMMKSMFGKQKGEEDQGLKTMILLLMVRP